MQAVHTLSKKQNPLGYESIGMLLTKFAIPAVISMLMMAIYNIVDQIFIGQGVGYLGNAATTIVFPMMSLFLSIAILIGAGGSAYAAIKLGEGKNQLVETIFGNVVSLSVLSSLLMTIFGFLFLEPMLAVFGATQTSMPYAKSYGGIILFGSVFQTLSVSLSNMARTDGSPRMAMYSVLFGVILNFVLDPLYIFVFHWGVAGAAIATVQSQIISSLLLIWYFSKKSTYMHLKTETLKPKWAICREICYLGVSGFLLEIVIILTLIVMNNSLVHYGNLSSVGADIALGSMGVILKIQMILIAFSIGIGIGAQPILGFNYGAKLFHRVKKTFLFSMAIAFGVVFVCWAICMLFPHQILRLFGDENEQFNQFAVHSILIYSALFFCVSFRVPVSSYFQATGQPLKAIISSQSRSLFGLIPFVLILPLFFGLDGILYAGPISDVISVLVSGSLMYRELKKLNKRILKQQAK